MRTDPTDRVGLAGRGHRKRRARRSAGWFYKIFRIGLFGALVCVLLSLGAVLPLRWIDPPTTAFMLQDDNKTLAFQWVAWQHIGQAAPLAVVASEDQKFADHFGFDLDSIEDSIDDYEAGRSLRGASTITQQVAKNLYLWSGRSFVRKAIEAYFTVLIEATWPKKRILEIYLNIAELGPGVYGVGAASRAYFGKAPESLTDAEAALLAAVLPNPKRMNASNPTEYLGDRQRWILNQVARLRRESWLVKLE